MENYVVGVDLGGTKIYTALADSRGHIISEVKVPTGATEGSNAVINRIAETFYRVVFLAQPVRVAPLVLGIGSPGTLDPVNGVVYKSPNLGWHDVPLVEKIKGIIGIPVLLENDANLAALGEHSMGAGRGTRDMVYVTVSTGIGGGLILDGRIYRGAWGGAGEAGHMVLDPDGPLCSCGRRGCLESMASGTAMANRAKELVAAGRGKAILLEAGGNPGVITAATVSKAAGAGDPEAKKIISDAGAYFGMGLANIINLINPERVVLGGGALQVGRDFWDSMKKELTARTLAPARDKVRVVKSGLGEKSGLLGAVALANNINNL